MSRAPTKIRYIIYNNHEHWVIMFMIIHKVKIVKMIVIPIDKGLFIVINMEELIINKVIITIIQRIVYKKF